MAEPLSVAASVFAVAEFAARSCECLYRHVKHFADADSELQTHLGAIKSLHTIFSAIKTLEVDHPDLASYLTADFSHRLRICLSELQEMESCVQSYKTQFKTGKTRRAWAKARWSSVDNRQRLRRQLDRAHFHYRTFSLDLTLLNV